MDDAHAIGDWLHGLKQSNDLSLDALGELAGAALAGRDLDVAGDALWSRLAGIHLVLHCDLYEVVRIAELENLCAAFIKGWMAATPNRERAVQEARAFGVTWSTRLTGYPLLYDYLELTDIVGFAGGMISAIVDNTPDLEDPMRERLAQWLVRDFRVHIARNHGPHIDIDALRDAMATPKA